MRRLYLYIAALIVGIAASHAGSVTVSVPFDAGKCSTCIDSVGGQAFTKVEYGGLTSCGNPVGSPKLPMKVIHLSVPYNAANFKVAYKVGGITDIAVTAPVYPVQKPVTSNAAMGEVEFTAPDSVIYSSPGEWPARRCEYMENGYLYGTNQIVAVAVYPVTYSGADSKLHVGSSVSVTLSYDIVQETALELKPVQGSDKSAEVSGIVENGSQVMQFAPKSSIALYGGGVENDKLDYCVITNRELAPSFRRLIGWKRQKGYSAEVLCIEDILSSELVADGDKISGINDDAGKLRWFLRDLYMRRNLDYALLAGDYKILPIRYGLGGFIPTDLYFSDFNGNWDSNKNGKYGEDTDKIDFYPEIVVGRLLCETAEEVNNYTDKLLCYEINPGNGDFSYLKRALYSQSAQMQFGLDKNHSYGNQANVLSSILQPIYPEFKIFEQIDSMPMIPTGAQIVDYMNKDYVGFSSINGHGNPGGVEVNHKSYKPFGIVAIEGVNSHHKEETGNGLNNLTNDMYPSVSYSMSCTLMPYDIVQGYEDIRCNFGRSYTTYGKYGGVAFLGNTREGYIDDSFDLEKYFCDEIFEGYYCLGKAEGLSKIRSCNTWIKLAHNLLGDPEFELWTDIPKYYDGASITRSDRSISLRGNDIAGSYVGITDFNGNSAKYEINKNNWSVDCFSPNCSVLLYRHNSIPEFMPMSIQNEDITGSHYMLASSLSIGRAIDAGRSQGSVSFGDGADVTFKVTGDVSLADGLVVKSGAKVTIICDGAVTVTGGSVENGGSLTIEVASTNIKRTFTAAKGAELKILKRTKN